MNLWYPGATQTTGPSGLVYADANAVEGVIEHSAEGFWSASYTPVDTMRQRQVSWHFSVFLDGHVEQHYPLIASCWHGGSKAANTRLVGVEHEGTGLLTEAQIAASVALARWVAQEGGWVLERAPGPAQTLYEHNEVNPATTCPNGRIPWERYLEADLTKLGQAEAIAAFLLVGQRLSAAVAQQDGMYVGELSGAPPGYRDLVFRVRED